MSESNETKLREALKTIVALNQAYCIDRYGDSSKAESMECVRVARAALSAPSTETSGDQAPSDAEIDHELGEAFRNSSLLKKDGIEWDRCVARATLARWGAPQPAAEPELPKGCPASHYTPDFEVFAESDLLAFGRQQFTAGHAAALSAAPQPMERKAQPVSGDDEEDFVTSLVRILETQQGDPEDDRYDDGRAEALRIWKQIQAVMPASQAQPVSDNGAVEPTPQQISDYLTGLDALSRQVAEREARASQAHGKSEAVAYPAMPKVEDDFDFWTLVIKWGESSDERRVKAAKLLADHVRAYVAADRAQRPAAPAITAIYAEARECDNCNHVGINDSHSANAACNTCGWFGPSPQEDHCPNCKRDGTMTASCPKCCAIYSLMAEANLPVHPALAADAAVVAVPTNADMMRWARKAGFRLTIRQETPPDQHELDDLARSEFEVAMGLGVSVDNFIRLADTVRNRVLATLPGGEADCNPSQSTGDSVRVEGGEAAVVASAIATWNASADHMNQWHSLDEEEKLEAVARHRLAASAPFVRPDAAPPDISAAQYARLEDIDARRVAQQAAPATEGGA